MAQLRRFLWRLRNVLRPFDAEPDLAREVNAHLRLMEDDFERQGLTPEQAMAAARRKFGGVEQAKELHRDARSWVWLDNLRRDAGYAWRTLRRTPGFTALAVLTLALGIAINTAVISVCDAVLLHPLPYPDAERLVVLRSVHTSPTPDSGLVSSLDLVDWQTRSRSFEAIAGYGWRTVDMTGGTHSERLFGLAVTPAFFQVFGISQVHGRTFMPGDRGSRAIVLGRGVWERRFAGNPTLAGSSVDINVLNFSRPGPTKHLVLGVVPVHVYFPPLTAEFNNGAVNGMAVSGVENRIEFWLPEFLPDGGTRDTRRFDVVAKLRPGITLAQAQADMDGVSRALAEEFPATNRNWTVQVVPLRRQAVGSARTVVLLLLLATGLVFTIAVANVSVLLLARGIARRPELIVRSALGASRSRIARHLVIESLWIAGMAAVVGVGVAILVLRVLMPWVPPDVPLIHHATIDGAVLACAVTLALLAACAAGLAPAWMSSDRTSAGTLNVRGPSAGTPHGAIKTLVAVQVAVTMMLLASTGLLLKSATRLMRVDPGFTAGNVLTMTMSLPNNKFEWKHNVVFSRDVVKAVRMLPGVTEAAVIQGVPMRTGGFWGVFTPEGLPLEAADRPVAHLRVISPEYFRVMHIPIIEGRTFDDRDGEGEIGHPKFILVNRALAARFWPGQSAVGRRLQNTRQDAGLESMTIAGVVGDVRYDGLDAPPDFEIYLPDRLFPQSAITLLVKSAIDPSYIIAAARTCITQIDPEAFVMDVRTMDGLIADSLISRWLSTLLLSVCGGVGLTLAVIGIYSIVAQAATQRRFEIGVRMALGSTRSAVVQLMLRRAIAPLALGAVVGLIGMTAVARLLSAMLFETAPFDPTTFVATSGLFALVALIAACVPAHRATNVDPMVALRCE